MSKKWKAVLLGTCIFCFGGAVPASAAEFTSQPSVSEKEAEDLFSDGISDGTINELADSIVEITTEKAEEFMEDLQEAKDAAQKKSRREERQKNGEKRLWPERKPGGST